jgi:hypothetical protein
MKNSNKLEEISAKCPCCLKDTTMKYKGEMKYKEISISNYRCDECGSCRTDRSIASVNPGIVFDKE